MPPLAVLGVTSVLYAALVNFAPAPNLIMPNPSVTAQALDGLRVAMVLAGAEDGSAVLTDAYLTNVVVQIRATLNTAASVNGR